MITVVLVVMLRCVPPRLGFDVIAAGRAENSGRCIDAGPQIAILNSLHISSDIFLLVVPTVILWRVELRWTVKLRVWIAGMIGWINTILRILRTKDNFSVHKDVTCKSSPPPSLTQLNLPKDKPDRKSRYFPPT